MRREGHLWPSVLERDNLLLAFHRASRGKRHKMEVRRFGLDLDANLDRLRAQLIDGSFRVGRFHVFKVYEPKERTIHAARFPERVLHHALINVCEYVFERQSIFHSYACRRGKGRLKGIHAAERAARRNGWYLKLDIRKYFESIPHDRLIVRLRRLFKDKEMLTWFERIIGSHAGETGRGLPIGSLTSQHLANLYLSALDRFCQGLPGVAAHVRYMDDFVCWAGDQAPLIAAGRAIDVFVRDQLGLALKRPPAPQRTALGMGFLGYRIFPSHSTLSRTSRTRYRRRLARLDRLHTNGQLAQYQIQDRLTALTAFTLPVRSWAFRSRALSCFRSTAIGHEPGEPGWQLEQQRAELPLGQPQQQQPGQPQQQRGLPPSPQLRPTVSDGTTKPMGLNRPSSRPDRAQAQPGKKIPGRPAPVGPQERDRTPRATIPS